MFHPGTETNDAHPGLRVILIALALVCFNALGGCASPVSPVSKATPASIEQAPPGDLQLVEALASPGTHTGTAVRWGGNVLRVDRDSDGNAIVQIIERRLDMQGRPIEGSTSDGRFVIKATAKVDPEFYARDRLITVFGTIEDTVRAQIGGLTQRLPVIRVREFMLWLPRWRDDPWWHHDHDRFGPNIRFGVGIGNFRRHHH